MAIPIVSPPPTAIDKTDSFAWREWFNLVHRWIDSDWKYVVLPANSTVSTTALANVSGMLFKAQANTTYLVEVIGAYQTAATTTGIALGLDIPSGSIIGFNLVKNATALAAELVSQRADNAIVTASTGVVTANTNMPIFCRWVVSVGATEGVVQLRQGSGVAASNTVLQAKITILGYRRI